MNVHLKHLREAIKNGTSASEVVSGGGTPRMCNFSSSVIA